MATYTIDTHETVRQFVVTDRADLMQKVTALRSDIGVLRSDLKTDIRAAANKLGLAQIAVAGLLFAALKLF